LSYSFSKRFPYLEFNDLVQEGWLFYYERALASRFRKRKSGWRTFLYTVFSRRYTDVVRGLVRPPVEGLQYWEQCHVSNKTPRWALELQDDIEAARNYLSPLAFELLLRLVSDEDCNQRYVRLNGCVVSRRARECLMREIKTVMPNMLRS
jgi:DNA-directed RNA polymerase specialized sigma24 family protein